MNGSDEVSPQEIADIIRERIRAGELTADDSLPTQAELAEEFGVGRGTVRQALRSLRAEGLVTDRGKGVRAGIAGPSATVHAQPRSTLVGLAPRLEAAFSEATDVRIDAVCLTAETLMLSMDAPMRLIEAGRARPGSITARIVLPRKEMKLLYPAPYDGWGHDERVDAAVHERSMRQHMEQVTVLRGIFRRLARANGIPASVTFRVVENTPYQKVYLLNGSEALVAHYTIAKRTEEVEGSTMELRDAWGTHSTLFSFHKSNGGRDALFVAESQNWFDALWESLGPDLSST
ncbi:winged helix-turn-helix domain-containing protein [Streptomyces sp. NPDC008313]|uniref:winged helix-turn-helix domain-containing protein n=1 Tax=Streptomyces sp. NPDC008313 TaxID=3364826 RepID=UPI0036E972EF